MLRRMRLSVWRMQLLGKFLAGTDAGHPDRDVGTDSPASQADESLCQGADGDRFAHVQDEDLAAGRDGGGLQYEEHGFWNRHEKAGHPGVGEGDRPALGDLIEERGYDAAAAPEYIAESHGTEVRALGRRTQNEVFGYSLGRAHHA